jgi:hypothetical protein
MKTILEPMMEKNEESVFELIEGLEAIDQDDLSEFEKSMNDEVIPEIVRVVEERRLLAVESRNRQLKR